ncbi:DNA-binding LytR/AlgR family response regulator [Lewinella aquimaris]|uniref:DNA-binding LytR/AlgR family response regulator n=1 Tax=Neolewinella aquimaris TaxID=1835722 RepID=A0A840EC15_9BACT|nr:LytTR family DNA-binding domain-containing protein [Neolewinella aquimaris]MBB4079339.1 DNA-binding LytR/AlgR family response regulator [Neolewinella aquimaris]
MIRCVIVEDEPLARKLLEQYVAKTPALELMAAISNPLRALEFLQTNQPDVLFLDVQMPEITGIGLLKIMKRKPLVVLTTAYSEYAIEGYELDVADYLLKPITFERFLQAVERISLRLGEKEDATATASPDSAAPAAPPPYLFIKDGTRSVRVNFADIQYIEGMKDYVRIHTPDRKVTTLQSLKHLVEVLPDNGFIRVHHSYIVGVRWIEEVQRDEVSVAGKLLPVSDTYRGGLREFVENRELK